MLDEGQCRKIDAQNRLLYVWIYFLFFSDATGSKAGIIGKIPVLLKHHNLNPLPNK